MRVLFTRPDWVLNRRTGLLPADEASDYQFDTVFHGAREILGDGAVDIPCMLHMYKIYKDTCPDEFKRIWGKGFTMYGNLDDQIIRSKEFGVSIMKAAESSYSHFDGVVLGIHHTVAGNDQIIEAALRKLLDHLPPEKIVVIDGWDRTHITRDVASKVTYFKRELETNVENVVPITFGIPEDRIISGYKPKPIEFAPLIPVNHDVDASYRATYKYDTEQSYYNMYQRSMFALTSKKGGWDTLRHYEIVANGCLPYFVDIEQCPQHTLWNWPKDLLMKIKQMRGVYLTDKNDVGAKVWNAQLPNCASVRMDLPGWIDWSIFDQDLYMTYRSELMDYLRKHLTTKAVAQRVLNHIWSE